MPENIFSHRKWFEQIANETHPERELSQSEIRRLASTLNMTLSEYERRKQLRSEPTPPKLRKQISDLHKALRKLKLAFPDPKANSLRNYLDRPWRRLRRSSGCASQLTPHSVGVLLDTGERRHRSLSLGRAPRRNDQLCFAGLGMDG